MHKEALMLLFAPTASIYIHFKTKTLLGHRHGETVTFSLPSSFSFIPVCYLGTIFAQNSGWAAPFLQTGSVKENQHCSFLSWLFPLPYNLSAAFLIITSAEQRDKSPSRSFCTLLYSRGGDRWERNGWYIESLSPSLPRSAGQQLVSDVECPDTALPHTG